MKTTKKTLPVVWMRLTAFVCTLLDENPVGAQAFCNDLDRLLDELLEADAFGTEGQNDPRGDHRQ